MKLVKPIFIGIISLNLFTLVAASIDKIHEMTAINDAMDPWSVKLVDAALHILKYNSPTNTVIIHSNSKPAFGYLFRSLKKIHATAITINSWEFLKPMKTLLAVCTFIRNTSTLQRVDLSSVHPQSYVLLTLTEPTAGGEMSTVIRDIGKLIREYRLYNVVILYNRIGEDGAPSLRAGRYDLFCDLPDAFEDVTDALASGKVFHEAIRSLCGYRLRVSMKNTSFARNYVKGEEKVGLEGQVLNMLLRLTNATADVRLFNRAVFEFWRENTTELIKRAIFQRDVWMSPWYPLLDITEYADHSYPHDKDDSCFVVPKGGRMPQYFNILSAFKGDSLVLVIASIVASGGIMHLVNRCESWIRREPRYDVWYSFRVVHIFLNSGVTLPKMPADRFVIASVTLFAYLLLVVVQCFLMSNLMITRFYPDIDTISELIESGYQILLHNEMYQALYMKMDPDMFARLKHMIRIEEPDFMLRAAFYANEPHTMLMFRSQAEQMVRMTTHFMNDRPIYHIMKECPVPEVLVYFVALDSPLLHPLNHATRSIIESGLSRVWPQMIIDIESNVPLVPRNASKETVIGSRHLASVFTIYSFGISLSVCVFIGEMRNALAKFLRRFL